MKKHCSQILLTGTLISVGGILSGCFGSGETAAVPEKPVEPAVALVQTPAPEPPPPENPEMKFAKELVEHKDCVRAFQIFQKYAAEGDAEAEAWLGRCYMNEFGTKRDFKKAHEYFAKAAEKNNPWGINGLGVCHQYGWGTPKNLQAAMTFYKKAAELRHPLATLNLARTYADEGSGFFDAKLAEEYFRKALELNAPGAKSYFALFLCGQKRYKEAVPLLQDSLDDPLSMSLMADCCQNGWGVPVDITKAVDLAEKHFRKFGAAPWSAELCLNAGLEEIGMNGVTERAKRCLKCAADQGNAQAQYLYASFIAETDTDSAFLYMLKSADNGFFWALPEAGAMLVKRKDYPQAIKYFMQASTDPKTQANAVGQLSNIYHYELKTPKAGAFWDVRGAALGLDVCRNELALAEFRTKGDEHFAKAAALFAEGHVNSNEFASKWFNAMLENEYDRLRSLADKNNADALFALGIVGCLEKKGHPNIPIGMELLEKAAKLNHPTACRFLGNIYGNGDHVKQDLKKALSWYQSGAEYGDAESACTVALMLVNEEGFKDTELEDFKKAFDKALELEVFSVAYDYGKVMEFLAKDMKRAEELYRLAATHGDALAMLRLHHILFKTEPEESIGFLWQAVHAESSEAALLMGDVQKLLECPRSAFIHFLKAKIDGDKVNAPYKLAECWLTGYGCETNLDQFWSNANEAYKNGCVEVCYLLGSVYRDGKICPKDMAKAKAYFEEGAKRGSKECKEALTGL